MNTLSIERRGGTAIVQLARPDKKNAMSFEMMREPCRQRGSSNKSAACAPWCCKAAATLFAPASTWPI